MWKAVHVHVLIDEYKENNAEFYNMSGSQKSLFWNGVTTRINFEFGTYFTGNNCKDKFNGLNMVLYIQGDPKGKSTKNGRTYYHDPPPRYTETSQSPPISNENNKTSSSSQSHTVSNKNND
ncbi:18627_t:CDS:2 [Racocetra fulgida]|uniref:18627_t:CDS:1 n=1 Tax=Racocetra fulgida TaxID=60492 RepID=A0A9N9C8F1_9GLOM|nr:18627_t:CDS:2 [Racocetra fulgida]